MINIFSVLIISLIVYLLLCVLPKKPKFPRNFDKFNIILFCILCLLVLQGASTKEGFCGCGGGPQALGLSHGDNYMCDISDENIQECQTIIDGRTAGYNDGEYPPRIYNGCNSSCYKDAVSAVMSDPNVNTYQAGEDGGVCHTVGQMMADSGNKPDWLISEKEFTRCKNTPRGEGGWCEGDNCSGSTQQEPPQQAPPQQASPQQASPQQEAPQLTNEQLTNLAEIIEAQNPNVQSS